MDSTSHSTFLAVAGAPDARDFGVLEKPVQREALEAALIRLGLAPTAQRRPRILIADDDPVTSEILSVFLSRAGYDVLRAADGREAIDLVGREHPDGLLLDLLMPDVDGFSVVAALRADPATAALPVLVLTGLTLTPAQLERLARSAAGVLDKRRVSVAGGEAPVADAEPDYRGLVESSRDWIWQINDLGLFSYCSPQVATLLGYAPGELRGRSRFDLMPTAEALRMAGLFARCAAERQPVDLVESENLCQDGRRVVLETSAAPFYGADGQYLGYRGIDRDVTARREAEDRLRASEREVRDLSAHLEHAREDEKAEIAREIHDELGGLLAAIGVDAHWLAERLPADAPARARVDDAIGLIEEAVRTLRRIVTELRPTILDDLGLFAAVEWQVGEFRRRAGIDCRLGIASDIEPHGHVAIVLFRILQECLTNIMRHAGATRVDVELWADAGEIVLEVADNGCGMPAGLRAAATHGLRGMRERARAAHGRLDIAPADGGGTTVRAALPLAPADQESEP